MKHNQRKIPPKKYRLNEEFFDVIDTEQKAYVLGFLYADGCNMKYRINIALHKRDIDILEKISDLLFQRGCSPGIKTYGTDYAIIGFNSVNYSEKLTKLGCVKCKSLILQWPKWLIDENLVRHFIRGYFDGDGSVWATTYKNAKSKTFGIDICGTFEFLSGIRTVLKQTLNMECSVLKEKRLETNTWKLKFAGNGKTKLFLDWLYKESHIYMNRKHSKYLDLISLTRELEQKRLFASHFTKEEIYDIRARLLKKETIQSIADHYHVVRKTIRAVKQNKGIYANY